MPHIPDSRHSDHDPLAIAAYAAGDATGTELQLASDLVASCADCAALHDDLRAISAALPELPAPVRPRDFTLTPEQAASLRPSGWRRFLAPLAGPRFAFAGPLGGGLATLGIAGLLVAGSLGAPVAGTGAGSAAAPESTDQQQITMQAPASPEASAPVAAAPAPEGAAPVPEVGPQASAVANTDGEDAPDASALSPINAEDPYAPGDTTGEGRTGAGPKATDQGVNPYGVTAGAPDDLDGARLTDTGSPQVVAIGVVGVLLLVTGLLIGGLRLIARRTV